MSDAFSESGSHLNAVFMHTIASTNNAHKKCNSKCKTTSNLGEARRVHAHARQHPTQKTASYPLWWQDRKTRVLLLSCRFQTESALVKMLHNAFKPTFLPFFFLITRTLTFQSKRLCVIRSVRQNLVDGFESLLDRLCIHEFLVVVQWVRKPKTKKTKNKKKKDTTAALKAVWSLPLSCCPCFAPTTPFILISDQTIPPKLIGEISEKIPVQFIYTITITTVFSSLYRLDGSSVFVRRCYSFVERSREQAFVSCETQH
jgi:hypothetical protein